MLENYLPDRKAGSSSSMSLSPGEGSSSLFSLHKSCFQITYICKTKANRGVPNIQMSTDIQTQEYQCFPMMINGFITYTGEPHVSTFTHVFNMLKSQHSNQSKLSLGPYLLSYLDCPLNTTAGTSKMWSVSVFSTWFRMEELWASEIACKLCLWDTKIQPKENVYCVISRKCLFLKWAYEWRSTSFLDPSKEYPDLSRNKPYTILEEKNKKEV